MGTSSHGALVHTWRQPRSGPSTTIPAHVFVTNSRRLMCAARLPEPRRASGGPAARERSLGMSGSDLRAVLPPRTVVGWRETAQPTRAQPREPWMEHPCAGPLVKAARHRRSCLKRRPTVQPGDAALLRLPEVSTLRRLLPVL